MKKSREIREEARKALKGNWFAAVGLYLITILITIPFGVGSSLTENGEHYVLSILFSLGSILLSVIISTIVSTYFLHVARQQKLGYADSFSFAFKNFWPFFKLTLLMGLKILAWTLLFIIPGIIASLRYSQAIYIKLDQPELSSSRAIRLSSEMMKGYKWKYFCLALSFIGWALLVPFTLFIGALWLGTYYNTARAVFYDILNADRLTKITS
ncbi:hypothetical protein ASG89_28895 [Paenibacillus sp. Soil766]|nr:hypothetical protein ASG89_28895 [Paenibacillus sp. Soil766]